MPESRVDQQQAALPAAIGPEVLEQLPTMAWRLDDTGLHCNAAWRRFVGMDGRDRDCIEQPLHPADLPRVRRVREQAAERGRQWQTVFRVRGADGNWHLLREQGHALSAGDSRVLLAVLVEQEATELLDELDATARELEALFVATRDAVAVLDEHGEIRAVNPAAERLLGRPAEDMLGRSYAELIPRELLAAYHELIEDYLAHGWHRVDLDAGHALYLLAPDGREVPVAVGVSTVVSDAGRRIVVTISDQSEVLEAQQQARRARERYELAIRAANEGVWDVDMNTGELHVSPRLAQILGYSRQELESKLAEPRSVLHPDDVDPVRARFVDHLRGRGAFEVECRMRHAGGLYRWVRVRGLARRNDRGRVEYVAGSLADIHDARMMAEALRRDEEDMQRAARRLQTLSHRLMNVQEQERGHLARELHDEIGQALTAAIINVQIESAAPERLHPEVARRLTGELNAVLQLVRNLSQDLRPSMLDDLGLKAALEWLAQRQVELGGFQVRIDAEALSGERFDAQVEVACYRIVQESLTNIVRHARAQHVDIEVSRSGGVLRLRISDDGAGFDARERLAAGTVPSSFGLVGMRERAALIGGRVTIESVPGCGTTVIASLPESPAPVDLLRSADAF